MQIYTTSSYPHVIEHENVCLVASANIARPTPSISELFFKGNQFRRSTDFEAVKLQNVGSVGDCQKVYSLWFACKIIEIWRQIAAYFFFRDESKTASLKRDLAISTTSSWERSFHKKFFLCNLSSIIIIHSTSVQSLLKHIYVIINEVSSIYVKQNPIGSAELAYNFGNYSSYFFSKKEEKTSPVLKIAIWIASVTFFLPLMKDATGDHRSQGLLAHYCPQHRISGTTKSWNLRQTA